MGKIKRKKRGAPPPPQSFFSPADGLISTGCGAFSKSEGTGHHQAIPDEVYSKTVPGLLSDEDSTLTALTLRARPIIVMLKTAIDSSIISTMQGTKTKEMERTRICIRFIQYNIYNQSMISGRSKRKVRRKHWLG